jgi:hypothetical protein
MLLMGTWMHLFTLAYDIVLGYFWKFAVRLALHSLTGNPVSHAKKNKINVLFVRYVPDFYVGIVV